MSMTYDGMTAALLELNTAINEKLGKPAFMGSSIMISDGGRCSLGAVYPSSNYREKINFPSASTPDEALRLAMEVIAKIPSADDRKMQAFQKQLAETIDMGREMGIDVKFINPIIETARELASNAITKEQAP